MRDLLERSAGENIGFDILEGARDLQASEATGVDRTFAARVLWLDILVQNVDRTARNPNVMVRRGRYWLIDHGAALPFHHHWQGETEASPSRGYDASRHLFAFAFAFAFAVPAVQGVHEEMMSQLGRATFDAAAARIPESLLSERPAAVDVDRRRAAYSAYLWKRMQAMPHLVAQLLPETT